MPASVGDINIYKISVGDLYNISKISVGEKIVYSSGSTVTYIVDTDQTYMEEVDEGGSCLSPATFTPAKDGWVFVGWRLDSGASATVLDSLVRGNDPVTLYAVFSQAITLSYNGNGNTGGATAAQSGARYYNNGNVANPSFTLRGNGFSRSGYNFTKWALGSAGGTQYSAGATVTLSGNAIFYAVWAADKTSYRKYNGSQLTLSYALTQVAGGAWHRIEQISDSDSNYFTAMGLRAGDDVPSTVEGYLTIGLPVTLKSADVVKINYVANIHPIGGSIIYSMDLDGMWVAAPMYPAMTNMTHIPTLVKLIQYQTDRALLQYR